MFSSIYYSVYELPDENMRAGTNFTLSACVDALEAETKQLRAAQASQKATPWRLSCIIMMNSSDSTQVLYPMKYS